MTMSLRQMTPSLGAEITGVDVANLDNQDFDAIYESFNRHSVVVIRDQNITPEQHADFSRRFGKLMVHVLKDDLLEGQPEIYRLSNKVENSVPQGRPNAGQYWHSDLTYEKVPSKGRSCMRWRCRMPVAIRCSPTPLRPTRPCPSR